MARRGSIASRESRKRRNDADFALKTRWNFQGSDGTDCAHAWHEHWLRIIDLLRDGPLMAGALRRWLRLRSRGHSFRQCRDNRGRWIRGRGSGGPFERGRERLGRLGRRALRRHWRHLRDLPGLRWGEFWCRRSRRQRRLGRRERCHYYGGNRGKRRDRGCWLLSKVPAWRFQLRHDEQTTGLVFVHGHSDSRHWVPTRLCRADSRTLLLPAMSAQTLINKTARQLQVSRVLPGSNPWLTRAHQRDFDRTSPNNYLVAHATK